jgi:DtxR family Mn-dependent transcriptional regulator
VAQRFESQEEYLEQIYRIDPAGRVPFSELVKALGVSGPSVSEMCRNLAAKGLVEYTPRVGVALTDEGRKEARKLIRRHRLAERLLTDLVGLPWERAHDEACKYEHIISEEVEELLAGAFPDTCPHGNPIDGIDRTVPPAQPLTSLDLGAPAEVVRIEREESQVLKYLAHLGLVPGASVKVMDRAPLNGPLLISVGDANYALGRDVADRVMVRRDG